MTETRISAAPPARVDRISFILGMLTAFGECVANESKRLAFSPPFYPQDWAGFNRAAEWIAAELGVHLWYEQNPDLASEGRLHWLVIYKFPEVLEEYRRLRRAGRNPALDIAPFGALLSYGSAWGAGAECVVPRMREKRPQAPVFARLLLQEGHWPPAPANPPRHRKEM